MTTLYWALAVAGAFVLGTLIGVVVMAALASGMRDRNGDLIDLTGLEPRDYNARRDKPW